jgi:hypothetical protein
MPEIRRPRRSVFIIPANDESAAGGLSGGDGGGNYDGMEGRVSALETHMEYVRNDLGEIKGELRTIGAQIGHLPTKRDLEAWRIQWLAVGVAIVALVVGGVVGGLALINHYAAAGSPSTAPAIIYVPTPPRAANTP